MGKISKLEIQLSHDIDEHYHYNPGEQIEGCILLGITDLFHLKSLSVTVTGMGSVSWTDSEQNTYQAQENYVDNTIQVAPVVDYGVTELSVGIHEFKFAYELQTDLPSSFIGKFGSITYVLKVSVKEDSKYGIASILTSEPFLVLNRQSLSAFIDNKSLTSKFERRLWSKSLRSGKISVILTVDKSVYSPGEEIVMNAEILNRSPKLIHGLTAMLLMHSTFSAQNHKHTHIQVVSKRRDNWQLSHGEGRRWKDAAITIPTYAPESRLDGCDIIDVSYELILRVDTAEKKEIKVVVPIAIFPKEGTKITNGDAAMVDFGDTFKSGATSHLTLDRATLQKIPLDKLLQLQCDDNELSYERPIDDGTLRINPLYNSLLPEQAVNKEDAVTPL
ncbi:arrestin domain-containing protein 3-like [Tubulanus polymorphus]|uniref:arrestin domain-containing protein 3-like n=1 Tax=Tubulanus polymorphus TaxID=672921 RepID=UPI003DA5A5EF